MIKRIIDDNINMKILKAIKAIEKPKIFKIKNEQGMTTSNRNDITTMLENFYRKLYLITES